MTVIAETNRLIVRAWSQADVPHYLTLAKDIGYNCFAPPGHFLVRDPAEAAAKIEARMSLFDQRGLGKFPIIRLPTR